MSILQELQHLGDSISKPDRKKKLKRIILSKDKDKSILFELQEINDNLKTIKKLEDTLPEIQAKIDELSKLEMIKGDDGDKGDTPKLGVDFNIPEDGKDYILTKEDKKEIANTIKVPIVERVIEKTEVIKELPTITNITEKIDEKKIINKVLNKIPKIDQVEPINKDEIVKKVIERIPEPENGRPPKHEIKGNSIRFENPDGTWGEWMHLEGLLGGKTLHRGGLTLVRDDLSSQCDGATSVFTTESSYEPGTVMLMGTQFPIVYRPTIDYTETGQKEITLVTSEIGEPKTGQTLIAIYSKNGN